VVNQDDYWEALAAELDRYANVPDDVLWEIVTRDGACMWLYANGEEPDWTGDDLTDRELASRICAGCIARRACLELELRTAGAATLGVWGGLSAEDRREVHRVWLARRKRGATPEGGEQP
jgi:WhiB family redox-sensing transcriptional regulator